MSPNPDQLSQSLRRIWGYDDFRYPQREVIDCLLAGQDCLAVLPTGAGKSICFQLPALISPGLTLVVSPLVALMEDQVQTLQRQNLPAACLHSQLSRSQRQRVLQRLSQNQLRLLYLSPETLLSQSLWPQLRQLQGTIQGLMVDEAHCLVQWGDSFRPAYRRLAGLRRGLGPFPIAAFTATADQSQQEAIIQGLELRRPQRFAVSPYRAPLWLEVRRIWSAQCRRQQLQRFLLNQLDRSGLVYVRTRTTAIALAQWLNTQGWDTAPYHGGLGSGQRRRLEQEWLGGQLPFVVCTNAFGLGINKPDTRWVVHYQPPLLLMDYLQEIGRAGRDGNRAHCLALVSEPTGWLEPGDRQMRNYFLGQQRRLAQRAQQLARQLPPQGHVEQLAQEMADGEMGLAWLHCQGYLRWLDPFRYQLLEQPQWTNPLGPLHRQYQAMARYLSSGGCRWQTLLQAFGYPGQGPCGHCDHCQRQSPKLERPSPSMP